VEFESMIREGRSSRRGTRKADEEGKKGKEGKP
jgi:hypothetical protein